MLLRLLLLLLFKHEQLPLPLWQSMFEGHLLVVFVAVGSVCRTSVVCTFRLSQKDKEKERRCPGKEAGSPPVSSQPTSENRCACKNIVVDKIQPNSRSRGVHDTNATTTMPGRFI